MAGSTDKERYEFLAEYEEMFSEFSASLQEIQNNTYTGTYTNLAKPVPDIEEHVPIAEGRDSDIRRAIETTIMDLNNLQDDLVESFMNGYIKDGLRSRQVWDMRRRFSIMTSRLRRLKAMFTPGMAESAEGSYDDRQFAAMTDRHSS